MILQIKIPQEFEQDYINDRFEDFFGRVIADIDSNEEGHMCAKYEKEIAEMFINVFSKAEYIKDAGVPTRKESHKDA